MGSDHFQTRKWAKRYRKTLTTRNTYQDALPDREFEGLIKGCERLESPWDAEARLSCLLAGRLGLRAGEITHLHADWIDWDRKLIDIPKYEPCDCGTCRRHGLRQTLLNDVSDPSSRSIEDLKQLASDRQPSVDRGN